MNIIDQKTIKVVIDTNVFISALLWEGTSHRLLYWAEKERIKCFATI